MKKLIYLGAFASLIFALCGGQAGANDTVLDRCFETQQAGPLTYWSYFQSAGNPEQGVDYKKPTAAGYSYCFYQVPWSGNSGGITQTVYLIGGVAYDFRADICYYNC